MKTYVTLSVVGFLVIATVAAYTTQSSGKEDGCPANSTWTSNKQSCYLYIVEKSSSTQAIGICEGLGAHLVSIGSKEENQFILDLLGTSVWIGLFRINTESCAANGCEGWEWPDGSNLEYTQWAVGIVPNTLQCVFMDREGKWDHGRLCSAQRGLVCEQKRIFPSTTEAGDVDPTTDSTTKNSGCPDGWTWRPNKHSCYLYLETNATSTQAVDSCISHGAQLVSIGSKEENQFILDLLGASVWIGLFRINTESCAANACEGWEWPDGSNLEYTQWTEGIVPNTLQCVFMDEEGKWDHGRLCSVQRGLVCEQKRIFPSTALGDVDPTTDSTTKNSDLSSTYTIVGVIVVTVVVSAVLGAVAYFVKTRRRKEREMHESGATSQSRGMSTGSGVCENDSSGALRLPTEGHNMDRDNSVHINNFTRKDADTVMYNNAPCDQSAYEDHHAYERINNYSEIEPEYTHLKSIQSGDTSEATPEDSNVVYANVEQK